MRRAAMFFLAGLGLFPGALNAQASAADLASLKRELPLIEAAGRGPGSSLVVLVSGDGGWATIEKDMAAEFNDHGIAVVGFDLREYLRRKPRTPDNVGRDLSRVIRAYSDSWGKPRVVLVGYSRGAGMIPFILNRLPADLDARLKLTAFVGLPRAVNMTFHWIDVIRDVSREDDIPVIPELQRAGAGRMICIFGVEEAASGCRIAPSWVTRIELPGGHHLERAYRALSDSILKYQPG